MLTTESDGDKNLSKLEAQLKSWTAKLDEAVAKAGALGARELDELRAKLEVAQAKLIEAKAAGSERWETFKDGVERAWKELERAFKTLLH